VSVSNACRKEDKGITTQRTLGVKIRVIGFLGFVFLALGGLWEPQAGWGAESPEVRRLGLSKVGETTLLTVVLDRATEPRITPRTASGKSQLLVDFPQARAGRLPTRLEGDDFLVEQVRTEVPASGPGVRIILEMFPDQPYNFWKKSQKGIGGQTLCLVGLKRDTTAPRAERLPPLQSPVTAEILKQPESAPLEPGPEDYGYKETRGTASPGSFAELRSLIPQATPLLQGLEKDGWVVSEFHNYDRPGQRLSRDFTLTNRQYPELVVKIAYLPANTPNTPNISIIGLSIENLGGEAAAKYKGLRQWNFAKIKQHYEDIGDFFDDALKPLRVKLREETKTLALRQASVFQNFLERACPQNPQVAERVLNHIKEKVNQRFEGVQYTISENPLVILNLVDFLYVRVYFIGGA
jgi:hypothetical protein